MKSVLQGTLFTSIKFLMLGTDKNQAIRISRFLMSVVAYLICFCLLYLGYRLGYVEGWFVAFGAISIFANFCIFYAWMRSGLNLRMSDPSLTAIQMVVASVVIMFLMYNANQLRGPFLIIYLIVFLFGIFILNTGQLMLLSAFALFTYGTVIYMLVQYHPEKINLNVEVLQWMALAVLLPFFAFVGGHISSLRQKLRNNHSELKKAMAIIHEMAIRDELTGLYNRRHLMNLLEIERHRANRNGQLFSLIMLDIDNFKQVNDNLGHLVGDKVLKIMADAIQNNLRAFDFCGRYGGEEFVLVMGQTTKDGAIECAERLRHSVESISFPDLPSEFRVTISLGVTEYRLREELSETLNRADEALFRAKHAGRNCFECA